MKNKKNAFTFSEIIVVILIIALLYTIVSVSLKEIRKNNRDTRRVTEAKELQIILEEYYRNEGHYPSTIDFGESLVGEETGKLYKARIPQNPIPPSEECLFTEYYYEQIEENDSYILKICLEKKTGDFPAGINCFSPIGATTTCSE
jgi:type II secretory pathway pseudopilin PulG